MRNMQRLENHPELKKLMLQIQRDIKNNNLQSAMINIENCMKYMVDQLVRECRGDLQLKELDWKNRFVGLINGGTISKSFVTAFNGTVKDRDTTDVQIVRSHYSSLINNVDEFLDKMEYPTFKLDRSKIQKDFSQSFTMSGEDFIAINNASQNHPNLLKLNGRISEHIKNKNFEDAATNMRLAVEYMILQYVKEYAQDLSPENLSTKITELGNRNLISAQTADSWHKVRKLGNKIGAHYNEEILNIDEIRNCAFVLDNSQNEFYKRFPAPSTKEIAEQYKNAEAKGTTKATYHQQARPYTQPTRTVHTQRVERVLTPEEKEAERQRELKRQAEIKERQEKEEAEFKQKRKKRWILGILIFFAVNLILRIEQMGLFPISPSTIIVIIAIIYFVGKRNKKDKE